MSWNSTRALLASSAGALALAAGSWFALRDARASGCTSASSEAHGPALAPEAPLEIDATRTEVDARADAEALATIDGHNATLRWTGDAAGLHQRTTFHLRPGCIIRGIVVDRAGEPIDHAEVSLSRSSEWSDADGSFQLDISPEWLASVRAESPLIVRKQGHSPAVIEGFGGRVLAAPDGVLSERLVLGESLTITGHFVDERGRAASRGRVRIVDATPLDPSRADSETLEKSDCAFDSNAGFELDGLLPRSYVLECELYAPMVSFRTTSILAGSHDVEIPIPSDALVEKVRGYLLTSDGASLADAKLDVAFPFASQVWWPKRSQVGGPSRVTTSRDGAFELDDVPSANAWIVIEHPSVPAQSVPLAGLDLHGEITLVAKRRARLQLDRFDRDLPGVTIAMLDASGVAASWEPTTDTTSSLSGAVIALDRGRSNPLTTLEGKYTLVVRDGAAELLHREVVLAAEQTNRVSP
jgi:hypothetical protein